MKTKLMTCVMCLAALTFKACVKKDSTKVTPLDKSGLTEVVARNIVAIPDSLDGHYSFFSLKENKRVAPIDSASDKWDVAFNKTTIIFNGGSSGPGLSEAMMYSGIFEDLIEAPEEGYKSDNASSKAIAAGSGAGWYNYSGPPNHIITPIPGKFIVLKTAEGKYAKMEIISYYKDAPLVPAFQEASSGWYTFRYVYQDNGSRSFQ
jgi:hypothetical protein